MATTQTLTVATMAANAGGVHRDGEIRREGSHYVVYVAGAAIGHSGSLGSAAHRLSAALVRDLRRHDPNWGVVVRCVTRADVNLAFGNQARGGGGNGGPGNPCVANLVVQYSHGENSLVRALEFAAKLLANCCG